MGNLSPDQWATVEELFEAASKLPNGERGQWLHSHCADPVLRQEVESLLVCIGEEGAGISAAVSKAAARAATETDPEARLLGQHLGPYRMESIIGHGGMGAVYLGLRDDSQYSQKVAVKLVRVSAASRSAMLRFRQERQILARLEHANIARLLDGGTTAEGVPYLVMEYVEGQPIVKYCEERGLPVRDRLKMFLKVCDAIDYAHRNLIVHRDIKPGNILINAAGEPKLLDFGIAKLMDPSAEAEFATQTGMLAMTPDYASPEQVRGEQVSPGTEVYSLGAVLYDLLSGAKSHRIGENTAAGIASAVCETEPIRPGEAASSPSARKELAGDLDNIVLMAMRKEPERRYRSVAELAADIVRYLEARPVSARADSYAYRAEKFIRRNRYAVAGASLFLLAAAAGVGTTLYQANRAEQRFQQVRSLAHAFIFEVDDKIANLAGSTEAREFVVRRGLVYLDGLAAETATDEALRAEAANAYLKIGDVQGNTLVANLGKPQDALRSYEKALQIGLQLSNGNVRNLVLAKTYLQIGQVQSAEGIPAAESNLLQAISAAEALAADSRIAALDVMRSARYALSRLARLSGDLSKELSNAEQMSSLSRQLVYAEPTDPRRYDEAIAKEVVALGQSKSGDLDTAIAGFLEAKQLFQVLHERHPDNALYYREYSTMLSTSAAFLGDPAYTSAGDSSGSLDNYLKSLEDTKKLYEADPGNERKFHDLADNYCGLGNAIRDRDPKASIGYMKQALEWMDAAPSSLLNNIWYRADQAQYLASIAYPLRKLQQYEEARKYLERALPILRELKTKQPSNNWVKEGLTAALLELSALRNATGNIAAEATALEALETIEPAAKEHPEDIRFAWRMSQSYAALGAVAEKLHRRQAARDWYAKSLSVWTQWKQAGRPSSRFLDHEVRGARTALERVQ